ncbi:hypothetical protein like AT4G27100 [Hibiscus trionum]|uniref:Rab-GAP TBC domain-containing protein n=1 Tax=Hibiscus trionum TaxID=183268 RepID=A0A9W7J1F5_HIBTR|nr:hypothetical protein like AT4G27100 [Hibiscus trionum]
MRCLKSEPADSCYQVKPECKDVPATRFKIKPGRTLSVRKWLAAFSPSGQLDIRKTLNRIHRGGIHPSIRGEVWEFLLGCYDPMSTFEERKRIRQHRRAQYARWKKECSEMFPADGSRKHITEDRNAKSTEGNGPLDMKVTKWLLTLHQIGLDVKRTDRNLVFYEKQENVSKLWDVLSVYAWIDMDVGYCQGMSDLCSPMIIVLEHEADAFWCFERLMRRLRGNFRCTETSIGVVTQLNHLATVTQVINPKLHRHFETLGGGHYLFAVRMLMVLFRREFSFCDSLYLWEMMWALEYDPDSFFLYEQLELTMEKSKGAKGKPKSTRWCGKYERENMKIKSSGEPLPISVFLVAKVLKDNSSVLLHKARGLDDVVKIVNDLTGNLNAKKACIGALKLHKKYLRKELLDIETFSFDFAIPG